MKNAYNRGEINIWVADMDMDNLPKVTSKNRNN